MAGSNLMLKDNQVLFKEGDAADGMYLIRKGELRVYLEKDGNEVKLATIGPGGMIGEMAFFDKKPRSASVKAGPSTEVTKITPQDFSKLMKQIPKWFVSIMTSLSTRLRETNDRLQKVENKQAGAKSPFQDLMRMLHVMVLVWHKEGTKEGKNWSLNRKIAQQNLVDIFQVDPKWIKEMIDILIKQKVLQKGADNYNNPLLLVNNKGTLTILAKTIKEFIDGHSEGILCLNDSSLEMLDAIKKLVTESAYDSCNIAFDDVVTEGERMSLDTSEWKENLVYFKTPHDALSLVKVSSGIGFKVNKKEFPKYQNHQILISDLVKAGLA